MKIKRILVLFIACIAYGVFDKTLSAEPNNLHEAVRSGNLEYVKAHHKKGANLNVKDATGFTPLHIAVENDSLDILKYLLESKAKVDTKNRRDRTPLHLAIRENSSIELITVLLKHKADVNAKSLGDSPLHNAIDKNRIDLVRLLLKYKADVNAKTNYTRATPLYAAIDGNSSIELITVLLKHKADVNAKSLGDSPLHNAIDKNRIDLVRLLLKYKADVNGKGPSGWSPLKKALFDGRTEIANLLRKNGAR